MSVKILSGVNELTSDSYTGRSIEDVRRELRTPLSIGDSAQVRLNGEVVSDLTTVLRTGDSVEFCKVAGEKG